MSKGLLSAVLVGLMCSAAFPATYYVDFVDGADSNDGLAPVRPFQHAPGDPTADAMAKAVTLQPGDTVIFKGGVRYEGAIALKNVSGSTANPIVFDGNTAGRFGTGRAIIDGGQSITGWKRCTSAAQAGGNVNYGKLFTTDLPAPRRINPVRPWITLNLCSSTGPMPVAQHPNPTDIIFQEDPADYITSDQPLKLTCAAKVYPGQNTRNSKVAPLTSLFTNLRNPATIDPLPGATIHIDIPKPVTIQAVGISPRPRYATIREAHFFADDKLICKAILEDADGKVQKVKLPEPVTIQKTFTTKIIRAAKGEKRGWTKINKIEAYDAAGENVLYFPAEMTITDPRHLTVREADAYDGMTLGFHGNDNRLVYVPIKQYDPHTHTLKLGLFSGKRYKTTRYCLLNSPRLIDTPGEYSVQPSADGKTLRLTVWPTDLDDGKPTGLRRTTRTVGFAFQQSSHIRVQGFLIRQNAIGVNAAGPAKDVLVTDCEITWINGTGVYGSHVDSMIVDGCEIHDNPGHTKGVLIRDGSKVAIRNTTAYRNTATALDFYTCTDSEMVGNVLWDNRGMHANGLTCYLGCENILIADNYVSKGHIALTVQQINGLTVRNNVFDGSGHNTGVGIWPGQPTQNVKILNNTLVNALDSSDWQVALMTNARKIENLLVENNIIDGVYGEHTGAGFKNALFKSNLYTRPPEPTTPKGEDNKLITDLEAIFTNPAKGDYRVNPAGPAAGKGATLPKTTQQKVHAYLKCRQDQRQ